MKPVARGRPPAVMGQRANGGGVARRGCGVDALLKRPLQLQAHMRQQMLDCENVNFMNSNLKLVNVRDANLKCPPALGQRADGGVQLAGATGWVPADKDSCNARLKVATMASYNLLNLEDAILHRKPVKRHS